MCINAVHTVHTRILYNTYKCTCIKHSRSLCFVCMNNINLWAQNAQGLAVAAHVRLQHIVNHSLCRTCISTILAVATHVAHVRIQYTVVYCVLYNTVYTVWKRKMLAKTGSRCARIRHTLTQCVCILKCTTCAGTVKRYATIYALYTWLSAPFWGSSNSIWLRTQGLVFKVQFFLLYRWLHCLMRFVVDLQQQLALPSVRQKR